MPSSQARFQRDMGEPSSGEGTERAVAGLYDAAAPAAKPRQGKQTRRRGDKERGRQGANAFRPCLPLSLSPCLATCLALAVLRPADAGGPAEPAGLPLTGPLARFTLD